MSTSDSKELAPSLGTASTHIFFYLFLWLSYIPPCVMVCFSQRYNRPFHMVSAAALSLGAGSWRQKNLYVFVPLFTTTHIGGGPVECPRLARNWSCDETTQFCWECALVRLGHHDIRRGGRTGCQSPLPSSTMANQQAPSAVRALSSTVNTH
jgi:hypothetical protein